MCTHNVHFYNFYIKESFEDWKHVLLEGVSGRLGWCEVPCNTSSLTAFVGQSQQSLDCELCPLPCTAALSWPCVPNFHWDDGGCHVSYCFSLALCIYNKVFPHRCWLERAQGFCNLRVNFHRELIKAYHRRDRSIMIGSEMVTWHRKRCRVTSKSSLRLFALGKNI